MKPSPERFLFQAHDSSQADFVKRPRLPQGLLFRGRGRDRPETPALEYFVSQLCRLFVRELLEGTGKTFRFPHLYYPYAPRVNKNAPGASHQTRNQNPSRFSLRFRVNKPVTKGVAFGAETAAFGNRAARATHEARARGVDTPLVERNST